MTLNSSHHVDGSKPKATPYNPKRRTSGGVQRLGDDARKQEYRYLWGEQDALEGQEDTTENVAVVENINTEAAIAGNHRDSFPAWTLWVHNWPVGIRTSAPLVIESTFDKAELIDSGHRFSDYEKGITAGLNSFDMPATIVFGDRKDALIAFVVTNNMARAVSSGQRLFQVADIYDMLGTTPETLDEYNSLPKKLQEGCQGILLGHRDLHGPQHPQHWRLRR